MTLTNWVIHRPLLPLLIIAVLGVMGLRTIATMPLTHLPDIGENRIELVLLAPGASLGAANEGLAQPVYRSLSGVPNVISVRSDISPGRIDMSLHLRNSRHAESTLATVRDRLQALGSQLELDFVVEELRAVSSRTQPVLEFVVKPLHGDIATASNAIRDVIRPSLREHTEIGDILVYGATRREILIETSEVRLAAIGVSVSDLKQQIASSLTQKAALELEADHETLHSRIRLTVPQLSVEAEYLTALRALPIRTGPNEFVALDALAQISMRPQVPDWLVQHNGEPAIQVSVYAMAGADLAGLPGELVSRLTELDQGLRGAALEIIRRPGEAATRSLNATLRALFEGSVLVIAVIAFSLRSWRATALAALAIPLSVLPTLFVMQVLGLSLNIVSLLALTLASGIVVDDAIVEIENIHKHLRRGSSVLGAVKGAMVEMSRPVFATSLVLLAVFLPVAVMPGEAGLYFQAFGYTLCIVTVFSLLVSRTVIPALALHLSRLPSSTLSVRGARGFFILYRSSLIWALRRPFVCLGMAAAIAVISLWAALQHPGAFIPTEPTDFVQMELDLPPSMTASGRIGHFATVQDKLLEYPGVNSVTIVTPTNLSQDLRLLVGTDGSHQVQAQVHAAVRSTLDARVQMLTSSGRPGLIFDLAAADLETLQQAAPQVLNLISQLDRGNDATLDTAPISAGIRFRPNPASLRSLGLNSADVIANVESLLDPAERSIAMIDTGQQDRLPIRLRGASRAIQAGKSPGDLAFVPFQLPAGATVPLASLGQFELDFSATQIVRRDGRYLLPIVANAASQEDARLIKQAVRSEVERLSRDLPGLSLLPAGDAPLRNEMMRDLRTASGTILILLIAVLYLTFRSLAQTAVIVVSLIFALTGGMLVLSLTGLPISLPVLIGLLLLLGIVAKNAILLIDRAQVLSGLGLSMGQALAFASFHRARPILMTSVAMIVGMLPAALPGLDGSAFRQPLAMTVIGGVAVSTLLNLIVTPALSLLAHRATLKVNRLGRMPEISPGAMVSRTG